MKPYLFSICHRFALISIMAFNNAAAAMSNTYVDGIPAPVSQKVLAFKIKDAEANTDLDEASKTRLLDYYHRPLRYREYIRSNNAATSVSIRSRQTNPDQHPGKNY